MSDKTKQRLRGAIRSRTDWLGAALAIAGLIQVNLNVFDAYLSPQAQGLLTMAVGIAVIVLRTQTRTPLEDR